MLGHEARGSCGQTLVLEGPDHLGAECGSGVQATEWFWSAIWSCETEINIFR